MRNNIKISIKPAVIFFITFLILGNNSISCLTTQKAPYASQKTCLANTDLQNHRIEPALLRNIDTTSIQSELHHINIAPCNEGSSPDQYQTYGNCWIGTNENVLQLAQSFIPSTPVLDKIKLKIWINFTTPLIDLHFYIYDDQNNQPHTLISGGNAGIYTSQEFLYSSTIPNPNDHINCPWAPIDFPENPLVQPGTRYWLILEIDTLLPPEKHVWLAGLLNTTDRYPNGTFAYNAVGWHHLALLDIMFITYGSQQTDFAPTAHAGGPYYGHLNGGNTILFDATQSQDNDEDGYSIIRYDWKFYEKDTWHSTTTPNIEYCYSTTGTKKVTLRVIDNEEETAFAITKVTIYPSGPPHVINILSYYADGSNSSYNQGFFLQGLNITNTYTAMTVGNNIDKVEFLFDGISTVDSIADDGWTFNINTKNILNPLSTLQVRAHNSEGWGPFFTHKPRIIPVIGWLYDYLACLQNYTNNPLVTFEIGIRDSPPLVYNNFWIIIASVNLESSTPSNPNESPLNSEVTVPVDDIGGDYSYSGGIGSSININSDGTIDISGKFQAGVAAKGIAGNISASLHGVVTITNQIKWEYMYLTLYGEVTLPVFYVPLEICGIGIEAGIDITPHVELTITLEPTSDPSKGLIPGLGIQIKDNHGIQGHVGACVRAYAEAGFAIGELYTEAGGEGVLFFQTPSPPGYLKDFILNCWIGGHIRILSWSYEGWWEYQWRYLSRESSTKTYNESNWSLIDREYLNPMHGNYHEFIQNTTETGVILRNVFPYAAPIIQSFPDDAGMKKMIIWTYDNPSQPPLEGFGLYYTIWEKHQGCCIPQPICSTHNDSQLQMDPQLAFDNQGNALCVFSYTPQSITSNASFNETLSHCELAYSIYNSTTHTWSAIQNLTTDDDLDLSPCLTTQPTTDILLTWIKDTDLNYSTLHDRHIYMTIWNGSAWSQPQPLAYNHSIVSKPHIAQNPFSTDSIDAYCVFTLDIDHDITTTHDQHIYYLKVTNSTSNTTLSPLSDNTDQQQYSPTIVFGEDTQPYCVWVSPTISSSNDSTFIESSLYYQAINTSRSQPYQITTGTISSPTAFSTSSFQDTSPLNFAVGWTETNHDSCLHCAIIQQNHTSNHGVLYGSSQKLSQTSWDFAPAGISAVTIERPSLKAGNKHCNVTLINTPGLDTAPPETVCNLNGIHLKNGVYGPIYDKNITITLHSTDTGIAGLEKIMYRLDNGAWHRYNNTPLYIETPDAHVLHYYALDRAQNKEPLNIQQFMISHSQNPHPPLQPCGPTQGTLGKDYLYYSYANDPDGDLLYYKWNWGDEFSPWYGPYSTKEFCVVSHTWNTKGTYPVQVITKDTSNKYSPWSETLEIRIPLNNQQNERRSIIPENTNPLLRTITFNHQHNIYKLSNNITHIQSREERR